MASHVGLLLGISYRMRCCRKQRLVVTKCTRVGSPLFTTAEPQTSTSTPAHHTEHYTTPQGTRPRYCPCQTATSRLPILTLFLPPGLLRERIRVLRHLGGLFSFYAARALSALLLVCVGAVVAQAGSREVSAEGILEEIRVAAGVFVIDLLTHCGAVVRL